MDDLDRLAALFPHQHQGEVYYDPRTNCFFQKRRIKNDDVFTCGQFHPYYEGAIVVCKTQPLSPEYIKSCVEITAIDKLKDAFFDGQGWRVRKALDRTEQEMLRAFFGFNTPKK